MNTIKRCSICGSSNGFHTEACPKSRHRFYKRSFTYVKAVRKKLAHTNPK